MDRKINFIILLIFFLFFFFYSVYAQTISFDKDKYIGIINTQAIITLDDPALNTDPNSKENVNVNVISSTDSSGITITLQETDANTGVFKSSSAGNNLHFSLISSGSNTIQVQDGDSIIVSYSSLSYTATWEQFKITSIKTEDTNDNGRIDALSITFNEQADVNYDSSNSGLDCLSITDGTYTYAIKSNDYSIGNPQNPLIVNLVERNQPDTGVTPTVSYNSSGVSHIVGNSCGDEIVDNNYSTTDGAAPIIIGDAETVDSNHNGMLDHYKLTFSENMNDSTFNGFTVAGHSVNGIDIILGDSANNDVIYISINETGYDTGDTPDITTNGSTFSDIAGNILNNGFDYASGDINEVDKAPPAFASITTSDSDNNGHIDKIIVQFSEDVTITDAGGAGDGLNCIEVAGYTIANGDYSFNPLNKGNNFVLNLNEISSYDTGAVPAVTYNTSGSSTIVDAASNEMLNGETTTTTDGAGPYMLTATFHDPDHNDIDAGDYISVEFDEPVQIACTNSTDFVLLNNSYGDTFGTGSSLTDNIAGDNYVEIVLGDNPHLILPGLWSSPGDKMPSGLGINQSGTSCVTDLAGNPPSNTPEVDIGGSGSNGIAVVEATDGADVFANPGSNAAFIDTDISVSIALNYKALYVALWYDIGRDPDGIGTQDNSDRRVLASGSGKSWNAVIPKDDPDIKEGTQVRFILDIDGSLYYSDGPQSKGGSIPWSFTIVYEQKDRVTIRNNMINPKRGGLVYINYYLNASKKVKVSIYDVAGDRVKFLDDKIEPSGAHLITWNGKNQKGQNCIPGLYYVLIKIGKKRYVKKVLVLR